MSIEVSSNNIVKEITDICDESGNDWFLLHYFPMIALADLKYKNNDTYNNNRDLCIIKKVIERDTKQCNIYDWENNKYASSIWIFPKRINGELPGFMLVKCYGGDFTEDGFTHEIYFAYIKPKFRRNGLLKYMVSKLPSNSKIWLEASNMGELDNTEVVWENVGFKRYYNKYSKLLLMQLDT